MGREGQGGGRFPQVGAQAPFSQEGLVTKEPGRGPSKTDFRPRPEAPSCSQHRSRPCPSKARGSGAREEEGPQGLQEAPPADLPSAGLGASCFTIELKFSNRSQRQTQWEAACFHGGRVCPSMARWSRGHAGGRAAHRVGCTCPGTQLSALDSAPGGTPMSYCAPGRPRRKNYPSPCSLRPRRARQMDPF